MCRSKKHKRNKSATPPYVRYGIVPVETVFKDLEECNFSGEKVYDDEYIVNMSSLRYKTFYEKGTSCATCGIKGTWFALEKFHHTSSTPLPKAHFNLYGNDENGKEVMITKDHIIPKSKGGKDHISNMQTLCFYCNVKKGNKVNEQ